MARVNEGSHSFTIIHCYIVDLMKICLCRCVDEWQTDYRVGSLTYMVGQ